MKYLLVHGGRSSSLAWQPVAQVLVGAGHSVSCPDLSDPETVHLADHVDEIASVLDQTAGPVLLAAHSYGGIPACLAAQSHLKQVFALVLIDAAVPQSGQSLFDLFRTHGLDPEQDFGVEPAPPFLEPCRIDWEVLRPVPKTYVLCTRSRFLPIGRPICERLSKLSPEHGWDTRLLDSGHVAMAERPGEVAEILLSAAAVQPVKTTLP